MRQTPQNMKEFLSRVKDRLHLKSLVIALSAIVVFTTTYLLILPAFTLDKNEATDQGGIDVVAVETAAETTDAEDQAADEKAGETEAAVTDEKSGETEAADTEEKSETKADSKTDTAAKTETKADTTKSEEKSEVKLMTKKTTITAEQAKGDDFAVSAVIDKNAKVPEDTVITATELDKKTEDFDYDQYKKDALAALQKDSSDVAGIKSIKFYDISLESESQDNSVEPAAPVNVKIAYEDGMKVDNADNVRIVHFAEQKDGEVKAEVLDTDENKVEATVDKKESKLTEASFETDGFSKYAVAEVELKTLEENILTADGKTLSVTVEYGADAQIPDGADLEVIEIADTDDEWTERSVRFADVLYDKYGNATISDLRFLDISIMVDGKEFEPKAPVEVKIEYNDELNTKDMAEYYVDEEAGELRPDPEDQVSHFIAVHYGEEGTEILEAENKNGDESIVESTMITPGFSDYDLGYVYEYNASEKIVTSATSSVNGTLTAVKAAALGATADEDGTGTKVADSETVPYISKTLGDNGDGTYTLGLSVTGSADSTGAASPVNVIIVYDASNSMTKNRVPMTYGSWGLEPKSGGSGSDGTYFELYKYENGRYQTISDTENYAGTVYRYNNRQYSEYEGQRYSSNIYRADAAEKTLYDFTNALFGYQDQSHPSNIQAALITFNGTATTTQTWTSTASDITNRVSSTGAANSRKLDYNTGTNWEGALAAAYNLINANTTDDDPTYVVFITDGAPSRTGSGTGTDVQSRYSNSDSDYEASMNEARLVYSATTATKGSFYGIYAYGKETDWLASLMYYAYNGSETTEANNGETFETDGYYNASSTEALNAAISDIFSKIVETMGVGQASIHDGTTSSVETTTGEISDLLEVDDSTFQYWLSWQVTTGQNGTYTFTMPDTKNKNGGNDITYTVSASGSTLTFSWSESGTAKTATYTGTVQNNVLTIEWTAATDFYNFTPPAATYSDSTGAVDWNLAGLGTLLDSVTYRVTFEVYPSQTTLDLIADLKNGYIEYDDLDANIKKYLSEDYQLKTNTSATLTYTDTRNDDEQQTKDYTDPDPVGVSAAKELAVSKKWNNTLDDRDSWKAAEITLWVTRDGTERYPITMSAANNWQGEKSISYGILTKDADGTVHMKTTGHDYSYAESIDVSYNWEIEVPTVHPMIINKVETMLVKVDENDAPTAITSATADNAYAHVEGDGDYYKLTFNGKVGYYKVDTAMASLTAVNHRRSYLDVVKTVTGGNAPDGDEFEFTMTVTTNATGADPENYNSDAWVWFDIWDSNAGSIVIDADAVSATGLMYEDSNEGADISTRVHSTVPENFNGYYCVPTGTPITVQMQDGYSLRFLNLPVGATYTIEESETMPDDSYSFVSIAGTRSYDEDQDEETTDDWKTESTGNVTGQSLTGTIQYVESAYKVTVTNKIETISVNLKKVKEDNTTLIGGSTFSLSSLSDTGSWESKGSFSPGAEPTESSEAVPNPVDIGSLTVGRYKLTETKAPAGYIILSDDVFFEVYTDTNGNLALRLTDANGTPIDAADNASVSKESNWTVTVKNTPGNPLPNSGGIGTTIFYVLGFLLVLGCGIVLVSRRRMGADK